MAYTVGGEDFGYRFKITVDKDKVPANLTDFPVYFDLSDAPAGFHSNSKSDGGDIRIVQSDGTTQQAFELVFYTQGSSIGEGHYKASSLSSSVDTDFYVVYGNASASQPAASGTYGSQNVWDSEHEFVIHCQEDPSGTILDSSANGYDGTSPSMVSGDLIDGLLSGKAYTFGGASGEYIDLASNLFSNSEYNTGASSSAWVNGVSSGLTAITSDEGYCSIMSNSSKYQGTTDGGSNYRVQTAGSGSGWHLMTLEHTANGGSSLLYVDDEATVSGSTGTCDVDSTSRPYRIGAWAGGDTFRFGGLIDEVRHSIGSGGRGRDWHDTMYNNQGDVATFFTVGSEEAAPATETDTVQSVALANISEILGTTKANIEEVMGVIL